MATEVNSLFLAHSSWCSALVLGQPPLIGYLLGYVPHPEQRGTKWLLLGAHLPIRTGEREEVRQPLTRVFGACLLCEACKRLLPSEVVGPAPGELGAGLCPSAKPSCTNPGKLRLITAPAQGWVALLHTGLEPQRRRFVPHLGRSPGRQWPVSSYSRSEEAV